MVTGAQKTLIQNSWSAVNVSDAGRTFYVRFSEVAPDAFALFKFGGEDVHTSVRVGAQADRTFHFIDAAVKGLDNPTNVTVSLDKLGQRHTAYGAKKGHFAVAEDVLLFTLEKHTGGKWNADTKAAWAAFYQLIYQHVAGKLN